MAEKPPRTVDEIIEEIRAEAETNHVDDLMRQWADELERAMIELGWQP